MVKIRISICKVVKWDFSWDFQTLSKSEWVKKMNFSSTVPKKLHFFTLVGLFFVFNFDISHMSILQNGYQKKEAITIKASEIEIFLIFRMLFHAKKYLILVYLKWDFCDQNSTIYPVWWMYSHLVDEFQFLTQLEFFADCDTGYFSLHTSLILLYRFSDVTSPPVALY